MIETFSMYVKSFTCLIIVVTVAIAAIAGTIDFQAEGIEDHKQAQNAFIALKYFFVLSLISGAIVLVLIALNF